MLLTIKEVAKKLKISLSMTYALIGRGEIPCYEIGSCKRVSEDDLTTFLASNRREVPKRLERKGRHF
ncbi:helix-turn-helix domain-containing protein [Rhodopirellula bahusiensis]|uniref:helix-turn-helix domain-containing protein n=1 Tax=Rhodopirellula bahusiensis TaxID=2014065 RepID=UPI003263AE22